jgi:hypothetical protein
VQDEGDATVTGELAALGVEPVPADAADVPAGVLDPVPPGAAADPDEVAAQPAAEAATARTASAEAAAAAARRGRAAPGTTGPRPGNPNVWFVRALKGISFVTFQMTLYPLARLYRVPSVRSWG